MRQPTSWQQARPSLLHTYRGSLQFSWAPEWSQQLQCSLCTNHNGLLGQLQVYGAGQLSHPLTRIPIVLDCLISILICMTIHNFYVLVSVHVLLDAKININYINMQSNLCRYAWPCSQVFSEGLGELGTSCYPCRFHMPYRIAGNFGKH